ncbi:MAG: hypothetical protein EXR81_07045 [Gammaproteobacteria bacterium]|nr:hypothetical protein [Gammaproteobacteria bacterium]
MGEAQMVLRYLALILFSLWSNIIFSQIFQKENLSIDNVNYSLEVGKEEQKLPYFTINNNSTSELKRIDLGTSDPEVFNYNSVVEFQTTRLPNLGVFFTVAVAAPGGSDTEFEISIIKFSNHQLQLMNAPVWDLMVEDGFYLGKINDHDGVEAVTWKYIPDKNEYHAGAHRYQINIYNLKNNKFELAKSLPTKNKYKNGIDALKEFDFNFHNQLTDFNVYQKYR